MASPFGTGFSFGAKPAAGFGTPQPQQASTGFGAAPNSAAPAFGAPAPSIFGSSTPAFSFGGAPANTSPSLFGASPAPAFGAPASTGGGLFSGGSVPVGAFGAAPSTPSLGFGAAAAPAFGATASPFGSTAIGAAAPATGAFSFAAPAAGAPSPFGAPAAASPSPFGFAPSLAGTAMQQQQQQQMAGAVALSSSFGPDAATKEIGEVRAAYTPSSSTYKFQHLFLNVVDNPGSRVKPANVDEMRWRQVLAQAGGPSNPEHLWPVQAVGFKDLLARAAAQQYAISENQERLRSLTELGHKMQRHHAGDLKTRTADVQKRHIELSARLLHVTRLLDALEARLAGSLGYRGDAAKVKEQALGRALGQVEGELAPSSSTGLTRRLEAVAAGARLRGGGSAAMAVAVANGGAGSTKLDERSLQQLFAVLKEHADGVRHLQDVLKRDQLDIQIMAREASTAGR